MAMEDHRKHARLAKKDPRKVMCGGEYCRFQIGYIGLDREAMPCIRTRRKYVKRVGKDWLRAEGAYGRYLEHRDGPWNDHTFGDKADDNLRRIEETGLYHCPRCRTVNVVRPTVLIAESLRRMPLEPEAGEATAQKAYESEMEECKAQGLLD